MSVSLIDGHIDDDRMIDNEIIKATDNEIIKALEDWMKNFEGKAVDYMKISFALDLINRQKAEIERLNNHIQEGIELAKQIPEMIALAQAEAVKEFAKRLKEYVESYDVTTGYKVTIVNAVEEETIENLVKEWVGENND